MTSTSTSVMSAIESLRICCNNQLRTGVRPRKETFELPGKRRTVSVSTSSSKSSCVRAETRCSNDARSLLGTMSVCPMRGGENRSQLATSSSQRWASGA